MEELNKYIKDQKVDKIRAMPFLEYVYYIMNQKELSASDVYLKATIDRRTWSKIVSSKIKPSLEMSVKIAFGLELSNEECKIMLKKLNYTLSSSSEFALVIRFCLENKIYNLVDVNQLLYSKGLKLL